MIKAIKRFKIPIIREISTGDVMYNMATVNTAVWYIWKITKTVDSKSSQHKR